MISRRDFLKLTGASAGALMAMRYGFLRTARAAIMGGTLDPQTAVVDAGLQFTQPLVKPPAMPLGSKGRDRGYDWYEIAVRQFDQQILSPPHIP